MAEAAFNTIAEIQRLRDAGIEQKQAEAITLSIHAGVTGGVATKADLELVRKDVEKAEDQLDGKIDLLRKDVDLVRTELDGKIEKAEERLDGKIDASTAAVRSEIATAKFDLTWRLLSGFAVLNAIMFAIFRYLPPASGG